ncbi:MAG TPA: M1 family metallopeptidase [Thermoanaerobaculia bacterium]|nr:M1 family metallopeptidase [Thermoanaerobaculia bacterium]
MRRALILLALLIPLPAGAATARRGDAAETPPKLQLPRTARPIRYAIDLTLIPSRDTFSGTADIDLELSEATSLLWLNATDLSIARASLAVGRRTLPARVVAGGEDFAGFSFRSPAGPGRARLRVAFTGKVSATSTTGIFHQKAGEDWYAFSMFEATDARRAFPCFDEPSYKVPWRLTLRVPREDMAVSNTPILSEEPIDGGLKAVAFAESKPLPSYLVAFGVGPFDVVDAGRAGRNRTPIRMIVPRGRGPEARYAAETTGPLLEVLEDYFGIPFPYEKLDNLVIPHTVRFGAMENAGLVTYNETILLATPDHQTPAFQREWASVCAHETAHQWFGDFVTLAWWNDTWLNESFATWMAEKVLEKWKPDWNIPVERVVSRAQTMQRDSLVSARMIRQPIESKGDIDSAFDDISYGKGSAVLSMFESWATPERFQKGVRRYLTAHAWGNATAGDFLTALEAEGGAGLAKAFSTFLDQVGVPVVALSLTCGESKPPSLSLSQRRLLARGSPPAASQVWSIPVCVRYGAEGSSGKACELVAAQNAHVALSEARACPAWVLGNAGERGYYAVVYDETLLTRLLAAGAPELSAPERVGVLRDLAVLADAGQVSWASALKIVPEFAGNADPLVVSAALRIASGVEKHLVADDRRANYERFVEKFFGAGARRLGWNPKPGENEETQLLRPKLLGFVARVGRDSELRGEAKRLARAWLEDPKATGTDTLAAVLGTAAEEGDRELFERFRARARSVTDHRDRTRLLDALGRFRDPALEKEALAILLGDEFDIRESIGILFATLDDRATREVSWQFFKVNFDALMTKIPREMGAWLPWTGSFFCDASHRADVDAFFRGRVDKLVGAQRPLAEALEVIDQCVALKTDQSPAVAEVLAAY